ncbi:TIGR01777 family protein [Cutibacterium sp. WCA-380-WT-3A]|uniref:TIGR01777 family protein n=1 Tax=Cutibacterium porci TaxID=2605781 RepID=A0A7K0J4W6_9ACTN|nr:TIGR01777 family oxidoreductase [Cutibacterium porci]MSS44975.1 TIGR01777 family protein [Cutibacterium porci]
MRIAIGGFAGLIGTALVQRLRKEGHDVVTLTRHEPLQPSDRRWDLDTLSIAPPFLDDVDAVVNLAGAPIAGGRWTDERKTRILASRIDSTRLIVRALASSPRCRVFLNGSAAGYYGPHGDEWLDEHDPAGAGFLAEVCQRWEAAANSAPDGVRVATLRTGQVMSSFGGMLGKERPLFQCGLGGRIRDGGQYMSWISLQDHVSAMIKILTDDSISGPVNLVGPKPCTNAEFTKALAKAMHRPAVMPFPVPAAKMIFGSQLVEETLCAGQRVRPTKLLEHGFEFRDTSITESITSALAGRR